MFLMLLKELVSKKNIIDFDPGLLFKQRPFVAGKVSQWID
jgi:hypothetical protein